MNSTMFSGAFDDIHDDPHTAISDLSPLLLLHQAPHLGVITLEGLPPSPEWPGPPDQGPARAPHCLRDQHPLCLCNASHSHVTTPRHCVVIVTLLCLLLSAFCYTQLFRNAADRHRRLKSHHIIFILYPIPNPMLLDYFSQNQILEKWIKGYKKSIYNFWDINGVDFFFCSNHN